jgi:hypothetical protein
MAVIIIEALRDEASEDLERAIESLKKAGIGARRRFRSSRSTPLLQIEDPETERALSVLLAANIRAIVRPP